MQTGLEVGDLRDDGFDAAQTLDIGGADVPQGSSAVPRQFPYTQYCVNLLASLSTDLNESLSATIEYLSRMLEDIFGKFGVPSLQLVEGHLYVRR